MMSMVSYIDVASIDIVVLSRQIWVNIEFDSGVFVAKDIAVPILILILLEGPHVFIVLLGCQFAQEVVLSVHIVFNFEVRHKLLNGLGCLVVGNRLHFLG